MTLNNQTNYYLPYNKYKGLIRNADVLLFRCGKFPCFGWWISKYTNSPYSHAALAHVIGDEVECLEFKELRGSRPYPLQKYMDEGAKVDVFRCLACFEHPQLSHTHNKDYYVTYDGHVFNKYVADRIIVEAQSLMGIHYDWRTILKFAKTYIPFLRFKDNHKTDDDWHDSHSFVCSTLITYCYRKHFFDPVPFLSDRYTSPGDLARSGLFWKLFTIY